MEVDLTLSPKRPKLSSRDEHISPAPWVPHLGLDEDDRQQLLSSSEWLSDKIINASQRLLKKDHPHIRGLQNTLLGQIFRYSVEPIECVQVLHSGSGHWLCVTTFGCSKGEVTILDSLYPTAPLRVVKQVAALLKPQTPAITLNFADICQQKGSSDCGLYAVAFATALCKGFDPMTVEFDQSKMRKHLLQCLERGHIEEFPSKSRKVVGAKVKTSQKVELFCHCRQPESRRMIQCHHCAEWYHSGCEKVTTNQWKNPSSWLCRNCFHS